MRKTTCLLAVNAQNPLHTFPRNFPVDGEVATRWQQVVVMEFWKRHDATDFCPRQTCYGETGVMDFSLYQTKNRSRWYSFIEIN